MNLSILQENLNQALSIVSRFVSPKTQLPILANILFSTQEGRLHLSATNLEVGIDLSVGAKIEEEGSIALPAKELTEYVSYLSAGKIDLSLDKKTQLKITSPQTETIFAGLDAKDFPEIPKMDPQKTFSLPVSLLSGTIPQIVYSAATDDTRPVLTGIYWHFFDTKLRMVATDGYRLSLKDLTLSIPVSFGKKDQLTFLIPGKTLQEIVKLIKTEEDVKIGLTSDENQVIFQLPDTTLASRLIDGNFPDYERILPSDHKTTITLDKEELAQNLRLASVFARESANVVKVKVQKDYLELTANSPQVGQNLARVPAQVEGDFFDIAFNYRFLLDFLNVCQSDILTIKLTDSLAPGVFTDPKDPSFVHIVMPVRLQD
jgi:DNA polymerase III subunit beta